ncbi:glycosyltransferase [Pontibacter toksunensis]|uniref:Glycosyltransferase n=1 Tax=Pontibacter toksunensis TaxID=1332631 RepID=A0ABW6C086_9BACT
MYSKNYPLNLLNKISDFMTFPMQLEQIIVEEKVEVIIAAGTLAGTLAMLVHRKTNTPYYVSFYEPHVLYMRDTGVWKKYDPRYLFQLRWEREQAQEAEGLITVSEKFRQKVITNNLSSEEKVRSVRNAPDLFTFSFSEGDRAMVRTEFVALHTTVGIYVGKYGDLYYKEVAFSIYKTCFDTIPDFRLIILSPQPQKEIYKLLQQYQIDTAKVHVASVQHREVPQYLSAADFAFATIKSYPSARYCSPVKIGEYWANGLPVLLTEGVGDDSDIIKKEGGGATFNLQEEGSVEKALQQILQILEDPNHRREIPKLAQKYRSPERIREAYAYFFGQKQEGQK